MRCEDIDIAGGGGESKGYFALVRVLPNTAYTSRTMSFGTPMMLH